MSWMEALGIRFALSRVQAKLGDKGMQKIAALAVVLAGGASFVSGAACLLTHFAAGDLMSGDHLQSCLALFTAGMAIASPGIEQLKVGFFARTPAQSLAQGESVIGQPVSGPGGGSKAP